MIIDLHGVINFEVQIINMAKLKEMVGTLL